MSYTLMPGDKAPNFEGLKGTDGKLYGLKELDSDLFKVLFFTCNHCPYVTGSDELTRNIAEKFKDKVEFIAINSNSENTYEEDSYENMVLRMKEFDFPWLYLHDKIQTTASDYGALKTPHFFLFDNKWQLLYTCRNTDNPRDVSNRTTNDLEESIKQATESRDVTIPVTNPIGCNIKWEGKPAHWMPPEACDLI